MEQIIVSLVRANDLEVVYERGLPRSLRWDIYCESIHTHRPVLSPGYKCHAANPLRIGVQLEVQAAVVIQCNVEE